MARARRKRKRKIVFRQDVRLVQKNDATRVAKPDTLTLRKAPTRIAGDNAANFRIKLRRKQ